MILMTIMALILSMCFSFPLMMQPISIGMTLLIFSLLVSTLLFFSSMTWFSFILFLIYIGGLLVMFAYVTALMPNLIFKKSPILIFFSTSTILWMILLFLTDFIGTLSETQSKATIMMSCNFNHFGISLYSPFNYLLTVGLALILLFILICVVKICYFSNAPLRPYKYA
uniref:NADH dehydrogenase subunit 6 n=1 Tax=Acanthochitona mahensis TaxID=1231393 RepID=UPI00286B7E15|nr:NADH dehydrogenase subunit 6 [Acanthochitona mahensis]WLW42180.1 NADH dehydrogenase subunit 6 [Acanthochitona mahensis]